jgi:hypothetical protein
VVVAGEGTVALGTAAVGASPAAAFPAETKVTIVVNGVCSSALLLRLPYGTIGELVESNENTQPQTMLKPSVRLEVLLRVASVPGFDFVGPKGFLLVMPLLCLQLP